MRSGNATGRLADLREALERTSRTLAAAGASGKALTIKESQHGHYRCH